MSEITIKRFFDMKMPEIDLPPENEREMLGDALMVKSTSSLESRMAMLKIARFFKREFHFDAVQYASFYDVENDDECKAYMWTVEKHHTKIKSVVVGGFCFRYRDWGGYGLQWIWLHPYLRNNGILTRHWKLFEEKFGKNFYVEPPLSYGMQNFLSKSDNESHINDPETKRTPNWLTLRNKEKVRHG